MSRVTSDSMLGEVSLGGSAWTIGPAHFNEPIRVVTARATEDVANGLRAAEAMARAGNWVVGFVSYDAAPGFGPRLKTPGVSDLPLLWFGAYPDRHSIPEAIGPVEVGHWSPSMSLEEHAEAVAAIRTAIESGYTYQANLTFAMDAPLHGSAAGLLQRMVRSQPKSYGAFFDLGDHQVVSISPELFLSGAAGRVTTRPMKGTAPRGRSAVEDARVAGQLAISEKERAGNMMIVDLLRNDLGRVATTGSVEASDLFTPEKYPTVWQLTSTVRATLRPDIELFALFEATFPSGSVTGAPKASTMDLIARLESTPRGVYCGAIGYIAPGGEEFEFSVAIRTGVIHDGAIRYHVGGGITYDSIAGAEYDECLWKALAVTAEVATPTLLETMLYQPGPGIELLERHLKRLSSSAGYWDIPLDLEAIGDALSAVDGFHDRKVRLLLMPEGKVEVEMEDIGLSSEPVELTLGPDRIDPSEPMWFHKTLDRARYPSLEKGEVIMVNLKGEITETNISNLMVRFGDEWVTPPIDSGCLPGVVRQMMLDNGEVAERVVTLDELHAADEIAVTNAVRGWRKAVLVE